MKVSNILNIIILLIYFSDVSMSQTDSTNTGQSELLIYNLNQNDSLLVKVIPCGFIFNGGKFYSALSLFSDSIHVFGGVKHLGKYSLSILATRYKFFLNHDYYSPPSSNNDSNIGYGKYKVEFYRLIDTSGIPEWSFVDSLSIDFNDADYPYSSPFTNDLFIYYSSEDNIRIKFAGADGISINIDNTDKKFEMWNQENSQGGGHFKSQNKSVFKSNSAFLDYPLKAENYISLTHIRPNECYVDLLIKDEGVNVISSNNIISSGNLIIKDSTYFTINSNSTLTFDAGSTFRTFQTSGKKTVTLGSNASIQMDPYSHLNLNNTIFQTTGGGATWKGIKLTDTYSDTIKNCVFKNTDTCINLYNSGKCIARYKKVITGNKFENGVVKLRNIFNALISNDSFYTTNNNHYLLTISNNIHPSDDPLVECPEEEESYFPFNISVANNHFSGGAVQMYFNCLASDLTPFYIYGNQFYGSGATSPVGMVSNKISGTFKYNKFHNDDYVCSADLLQSNLNFYSNNIQSGTNVTVNLLTSSYGLLCPLFENGNFVWYGGLNELTSDAHSDIYFGSGSNINTNYGKNCFTINNFELL